MPDLTETLATIAHDLWMRDMRRRGWRYGPDYDPAGKTHDALVAFDQLDKHDRRQALLGIHALDLERDLLNSIRYERGPARLFTAEEMRKGLRVGFNTECLDRITEPLPGAGEVIGWAVDPDGWLCSITVLWDDGERTTHVPAARELTRLGPPDHDAPA